MESRLKLYLLLYMERVENDLENDILQLETTTSARRHDNIDFLYALEANVRAQTISECFKDIRNIILIVEPP